MANPSPHPGPLEITPQQSNLLFKTDDVPRSADTEADVGFCVGKIPSKGASAILVAILVGAAERALDGPAVGATEGPSLACCSISDVGVEVVVGMVMT